MSRPPNQNNIVNYYKIYADDTGRRVEDIFESNLDIHCLWDNAVNAFTKYSSETEIINICGDMRIIFAREDVPGHYKFQQFYLSGLDGKIVTIPSNTWMGIQNLNSSKCFYLFNPIDEEFEEKRMPSDIFNWGLKS